MEKVWNVKIDGRYMDTEEIIDAILENRGIDDVNSFLHPNEDNILPLEDLCNIERAAQIILDGVESNKTFYVHYDTDTDGCTAGSIAARYLEYLGADVYVGINHGKKHGIEDLDPYCIGGADIVWIVDSIQTSIESYEELLNMGIQIIITDHHLIEPELCEEMEKRGIVLVSSAVNYANPDLSGSATTWKLCKMMDYLNLDDYADNLIDLAATGLVSDMCSMASMENRAICNKAFNSLRNPGIKKINGSYAFVARNISFGVAPKINAANRVDNNELAMNIFLTDDENEIAEIVKGLNNCRTEQNKIVDKIMPILQEQAESQMDNKAMFFFIPDDTEASVSGLIGNKLLEQFQRPLFILKKWENEYAGSMRAVGVHSFKEYCDNTGIGTCAGHENAAGFNVPIEQFEDFKAAILDALKDVEFVTETNADIQLTARQVTGDLIKKLNALNRISGTGFEPVTVMIESDNYEVASMSNGKHLKIVDDTGMIFVKWNYNGNWNFNGKFCAIGTLERAHYGRYDYLQLTIQDWKCIDNQEDL